MKVKRTRKKDINTPEDIRQIVQAFFEKLRKDTILGPYFNDNLPIDWDSFLSAMCSFWENVLFYSGGYYGNPMQRHRELHSRMSFTPEHFKHWLVLFNETVDELHKGVRAEIMKEKAVNIAAIMQVKILE